MKIIVTVKQVPDTSGKVAVNPDGTLNRASMQTIINPDDMNAVEAALQLKEETGCKVIAVTMGPPPAEGMLRELMAMGVDEGVLVSAREFGGSDTFATSQILAAAINKLGVEKGRAAYYSMIGLVCAGSVVSSTYLLKDAIETLEINSILPILCLASVGIYFLSWYMSIVFYKKREL